MGNEIKISDLTEKLQALANKANQPDAQGKKDDVLDNIELSIFRGYVNDAEAHQLLTDDDKANLKSIMGFTPVARSLDDVGVEESKFTTNVPKANEKSVTSKTDEAIAKANGMTVQELEVTRAFLNKIGYNPEDDSTNGTLLKDAFNAVEKEYKGKGKEYKKALKSLHKTVKHDYAHYFADKVRNSLDGTKRIEDANYHLVDIKVTDENKVKNDSYRKVRKAAKQAIKDNHGGKLDTWMWSAYKGTDRSFIKNLLTVISYGRTDAKKSDMGIAYGHQAANARNERFTEKDMKKAIGNKAPFLQPYTKTDENGNKKEYANVLEAAGLIKAETDEKGNKTGKYDITKLSLLVADSIGYNNTLDEHNNEGTSETQKIRVALNTALAAAGIKDFEISKAETTSHDVRQLVQFVKYYNERRYTGPHNVMKYGTLGAAAGAAAGGAGGAYAAYRNPKVIIDAPVDIEQNVTVPITADETVTNNLINNPDLQKALDGIGSIEQVGSTVTISVHQAVHIDRLVEVSKHIMKTSQRAALIAGGLGALGGGIAGALTREQEKGIIDIAADCDKLKTFEEASAAVDAYKGLLSQTQINALKLMLMEGIELEDVKDSTGKVIYQRAKTEKDADGNCKVKWNLDCCEIFKKLRAAAGNQELNSVEFSAWIRQNVNGALLNNVVKGDCKDNKVNPTYCEGQYTVEGEEVKVDVKKTPKFEDWGQFASRYDENCIGKVAPRFKETHYDAKLKKNVPGTYPRRMMKVLQAITDNNYDINRLKELTDKAMKSNWETTLKNVEGFNLALFKSLMGNRAKEEFGMDQQNMPNITITDKNGVKTDLCEPAAPEYKAVITKFGKGKKASIGDAKNSHKGEDVHHKTLTTSDNRYDIDETDQIKYDEKKKKVLEDKAGYQPCK